MADDNLKRNQTNNDSGRGAGESAGTSQGDQKGFGARKTICCHLRSYFRRPNRRGLVQEDARSIFLNGVPAVNQTQQMLKNI